MIPALSIRQPWAWLIVHGYKTVENRDWPTPFRGRMLVHAGQTLTRSYYRAVLADLTLRGLCPPAMPVWESLPRGGLTGWTHLVDCVRTCSLSSREPRKCPFGMGCKARCAAHSLRYGQAPQRRRPPEGAFARPRMDSEHVLPDHPSPWKDPSSAYGFVLQGSRPIAFVPWKGQLGFFNVPQDALAP